MPECPNTWKETFNMSTAPFPTRTATLLICTVSVESHLSLLFREIPIVFKTRSSLTAWPKKKYLCTKWQIPELDVQFGRFKALLGASARRVKHQNSQVSHLLQKQDLVWLSFNKVGDVSSFILSRVANMSSSQQHMDTSMFRTRLVLLWVQPITRPSSRFFFKLMQSKSLEYKVNMRISTRRSIVNLAELFWWKLHLTC